MDVHLSFGGGDAICCGDGCIETEREQQRTLRSSHAFLLALSATGCRDVNPRAAGSRPNFPIQR